ncbi:conserved hypothetical protein [Neospora caninum Liverpool]|uniref:Apicomplexan specific protein, related n=1 Tax=Neospora caninum (strain Liverpool) TaxID=572307 RepID=F0VPN8_NEOCL|nr:conserved hypothetical protein [Neospora caninum Liverpool]CBZ55685.1 conserved hypothetical protein [Neospora caninum Liverpool]CEL70427.1 TPA: hypothetical protein BN1204_061090 [Neospora caninum Liverpool]|eukprot:XP_003885711.1 conserved hypothetical protein [Neospora caninum Liverpool]
MASGACLTIHSSPNARLPHCSSCEFRPRTARGNLGGSGCTSSDDEDEYEPSVWAELLAAEAAQWEDGEDPGPPKRGKVITEKARAMLCESQRCRTWLDLKLWFGFEEKDLSAADFNEVFISVRNEGSGLFEHFVELGKKTLETLTEMFFFRHYSVYAAGGLTGSDFASFREGAAEFVAPLPMPLPPDFQARLSQQVPQLLYTQKHTDRTCAPVSLYRFGLAYLAGAQGVKTRQAVVEYVHACIGYACCCSGNNNKSLYVWGSVLIEHIYWTQRVTSGNTRDESALIHDLQEYLGYKYSTLTPKVLRALDATDEAKVVAAPPGERVLRVYLEDFFEHLADESGVDPEDKAAWTSREIRHFLASPAIPLFSCLFLSLSPFLAEPRYNASALQGEKGFPCVWGELPPSTSYVSAFMALLSVCWRQETEDTAKVWMKALVQRLRQLQLVAEVVSLDAQNLKARQRRVRSLDVRRMDYVNEGLLGKYLLWSTAFEQEDATRRREERAALEAAHRLDPTPEALALFASQAPLAPPCGGVCAPVSRVLGAFGVKPSVHSGRSEPRSAFPRSYGLPTSRGLWTIRDTSGKVLYEMIYAGGPVQPFRLQQAAKTRANETQTTGDRQRLRVAPSRARSNFASAALKSGFYTEMPFS